VKRIDQIQVVPGVALLALFCLVVLLFGLSSTSRAYVPTSGEVLVLDTGIDGNYPRVFSVSETAINTLVLDDEILNPTCISGWTRKRAIIGGEDRVYIISVQEDGLGTVYDYTHLFLESVVDIFSDGGGGWYIIDQTADPFGEGNQGAIFHRQGESNQLSVVASHPDFTYLSGAELTDDGKLLVFDPYARFSPSGPVEGVLFEVDPQTRTVTSLRDLSFAHRPTAMGLLNSETLLFLDPTLSVPGYMVAGGGLIRMSTANYEVIDSLGAEPFAEPVGLSVIDENSFVVLDTDAVVEGENLPGALIYFSADPWEIVRTYRHAAFGTPIAIHKFSSPELDDSRFELVDLSGGAARAGDLFSYQVDLVNEGDLPALELELILRFNDFVTLPSQATTSQGELGFEESTNTIRWDGDIAPGETVAIRVECRIPDATEVGTAMSVNSYLYNNTININEIETVTTTLRFEHGAVVYLDIGEAAPAPRIFTISDDGYTTSTLYSDAELMKGATDITFGPDGMLYLLAGERPSERKIIRIDPITLHSEVIHEGLPLTIPTAICPAHDGNILIADAKGNFPFNVPGVIYKLDLSSLVMTSFIEDPDLLDPGDICADIEGGYMISDFSSPGGDGGQLFEVSGDGEILRRLNFSFLEDPHSAVVEPSGNIFLTDRRASSDPQVGRVYRFGRDEVGGNISWSDLSGDGDVQLVDPTGIELLGPGRLVICDQDGQIGSTRGAIFHLTATTEWELSFHCLATDLVDPVRMTIFNIPDLQSPTFAFEDPSGGDLVAGDTLIARTTLLNSAPTPAVGIDLRINGTENLQLLSASVDSDSPILLDRDTNFLQWSGNLAFQAPLELTARYLVDPSTGFGEKVTLDLTLEGAGETFSHSLSDTVVAVTIGGEMMVLDATAAPYPPPAQAGAIFLAREGDTDLSPYKGFNFLVHPVDLIRVSDDELLILDDGLDVMGYGTDTGSLVRITSNQVSAVATDSRFVNPYRVLAAPQGGWYIMDPDAVFLEGEAIGAVFYVTANGEVSVFSVEEEYRRLSDMCIDGNGRLWLSDTESDAGETGSLNPAAIFHLDSEGEIYEIISHEDMAKPTGLLWNSNWGLIFNDSDWYDDSYRLWIRRWNIVSSSFEMLATSHMLTEPSRLFYYDQEWLILVDPEAYTPETLVYSGAIFDYRLGEAELSVRAASADTEQLMSIAFVPQPAPELVSFTKDGDPWAALDEEMTFSIKLTNLASTVERFSDLNLSLGEHLLIDPVSPPAATSGTVSHNAGVISWSGSVEMGDTVTISYAASLSSSPETGSWFDQSLEWNLTNGDQKTAALHTYISKVIGATELLVLDSQADPLGLHRTTGALFRIETPARIPVPILADPLLTTPVAIDRIPNSESEFLIVDADAVDTGSGDQGGILHASTMTGRVEFIFSDPTLVSPRAIVVVDSTLCYLLDGEADPYNIDPGNPGPGAIYAVNLETGIGSPVFSNTVMDGPRDMLLDEETGHLFLLDSAESISPQFQGAVLEVNPGDGSFEEIFRGEPLVSPRALTWGRKREYLVVTDPRSAIGSVFHVYEEGFVETVSTCPDFYTSTPPDQMDIFRNSDGRMIIAHPTITQDGVIFQSYREALDEEFFCAFYTTASTLNNPVALYTYFEDTPVLMEYFNLFESEAGVTLSWRAPDMLAGSEYFIYRKPAGASETSYDLLNLTDPISGRGQLQYLDDLVAFGETYDYKLLALLPNGSHREFGPIQVKISVSAPRFGLERIHPNPSSHLSDGQSVTIRFRVGQNDQECRLGLFDVSGRLIRTLHQGLTEPGSHIVSWDGRNAAGAPVGSGIYFIRLQSGAQIQQRRMVLIN
jgi:FlgD Ig-like domain